MISIYICIAHNSDAFHKKNYKKYTKKEFLDMVQKIASNYGINDLSETDIVIEKLDTPGKCFTIPDGLLKCCIIMFDKNLLNGKDYTISEVEEIIKHELSHYIADTRHKDNCNHDKRWKEVAKEFGCSPNEILNPQANLRFNIEKIKTNPRKFYYYLRCSKCNKIHYKTSDFDGVFKLFLISGTDILLPLKYNGLPMKSRCCDVSYKFEADTEILLKEVKKPNNKGLNELKEKLIEMLQN